VVAIGTNLSTKILINKASKNIPQKQKNKGSNRKVAVAFRGAAQQWPV
jgi:hypothetical protein